tara:strand:+ start:281 stop:1132 length:852 start_codon:yes stop_codon:yes gene_type:complete
VNKEKVSIYIPAYNAENTIRESIESIFKQTLKFDEIIVIDDNSTDATNKIVKEYKNINLIKNETNKGLGYNRNLGIKNSSNNIIASIDADVVLNDMWLEVMIEYFDKNQNLMCGGKMSEKLIENKYNAWRAKYYSQNWGDKDIINPPFLYGCNTIQHKLIWETVNGYNNELLTNGEDIDYCNRISLSQKFELRYCCQALSEHLQNDDINSLSNRIWRYHSFAYKIKNPSIFKTIKLSIKQLKFFLKRSISDLLKLDLKFIYINFMILINFIRLEHSYYRKNKK